MPCITVAILSPKEEKAATVAPVPPERPAIYHRNKAKSCSPDIFVRQFPKWNPWLVDPFVLV
jgi:hypothetical protein